LKAREKIARVTRIDYLLFFVLSGLVLVLIFSIIILASVPPASQDALNHHLAVPKLYLKQGRIYEIPSMVFSYYPMNLDLLYLIPLYFGNDIVPKFIHFSFALLTSWLIFHYLKRRINIIYALFGVIFFLSIPIIARLSITVYVDLGLIFFTTASLLLLFKWIEDGFPLKFLIISASICGLALGTKYNGLITLLLFTLFVPYLYSKCAQGVRPSFFKAAGFGGLFIIVALLFFSPWMIRNYLWTNNPIFPLYDSWFNPQLDTGRMSVGLFTFRSLMYHENWWQMALLPLRIFFQGQDGNPQYFDGELNPLLLILPFFAFYQIRKDPQIIRNEKKIIIAFAVLFFALASLTSSLRMRYISPLIPPLVILSVFGVKNLWGIAANFSNPIGRRIGRAIIFLVIFFSLWLNANYIFNQYRKVRPFDYLGGGLTREEYIERRRPEYSAMKYINNNLGSDARILFIYIGNRGYYCDREYVFDMNRNKSTLRQLVKRSSEPKEVLLGLKEMGITHLLINYEIFDRWVQGNFTIEGKKMLQRFFKEHVKLLYLKSGYGISCLGDLPVD
jgi:4-amino-4-deoxy-L-arabinose transferase-like glycosyltransferase